MADTKLSVDENGPHLHLVDGVPDDGFGQQGDVAFEANSVTFYGPKTLDGWGDGVTPGVPANVLILPEEPESVTDAASLITALATLGLVVDGS